MNREENKKSCLILPFCSFLPKIIRIFAPYKSIVMKKILLICALVVSAVFAVQAESSRLRINSNSAFVRQQPEQFDAGDCATVKNPESPCNQGDESFSDFIAKFNKDKKFRQERLSIQGMHAAFEATDDNGKLAELKSNLKRFSGKVAPIQLRRTYNSVRWATYYAVAPNIVGFYSFEERGGEQVEYILGFERLNGLWHLTYARCTD